LIFSSRNLSKFHNLLGNLHKVLTIVPSEIRRFKFKVSWLCDDNTTADTFVVECPRQRTMAAHIGVVEGLQFLRIEIIPITFRDLVGDSRMGTAIVSTNRYECQMFLSSHSFCAAISCVENAHPIHYIFRLFNYPSSCVRNFGATAHAIFAPSKSQQAPLERLLLLTTNE
jgi:hypothetical protein